jgi:DNA-binding Xre family transcriptional regulator
MNGDQLVDYSAQLQELMGRVEIPSYRALSGKAGVSRWAINLLRQGKLERLRVDVLMRLSQTLATPLPELIARFSAPAGNQANPPGSGVASDPPMASPDVEALRHEYKRLQQAMAEQKDEIRQRVQRDAIATLESWLIQWPTAAYAAQNNPDLPASKLLPLAKPLEKLLQSWEITSIGTVGQEEPFDPTIHQPREGHPQAGQMVRIRNVGYRHGDKIVYRAKVSPASSS